MLLNSVADPYTLITDPDPGLFCYPDPVPDPAKKTLFSKAVTQILGKILVFNQKVGKYFIKQAIFLWYRYGTYHCKK